MKEVRRLKTVRFEHEKLMEFLGLDPETEIEEISQPVWDNIGETWVIDVK